MKIHKLLQERFDSDLDLSLLDNLESTVDSIEIITGCPRCNVTDELVIEFDCRNMIGTHPRKVFAPEIRKFRESFRCKCDEIQRDETRQGIVPWL